MEADFWLKKWTDNDIAFHQKEANPFLVKHFHKLALVKGSRIFLPLCGKTLDIHWLLSNGYRVVGAELSKIAIEQLFDELHIVPKLSKAGKLFHYSAKFIDIYVGDIFDLSNILLEEIDAIYDRAALVALPLELRKKYSAHLMAISNNAIQLLICFEYDQSLSQGPPFSISKEEVLEHYKSVYDITLLESINFELRGKTLAQENIWKLKPRDN